MFQFEGSITVLTQMMVDPAVTEKRGGGKNLPLRRGEILDVIEFTNKDQILCRNSQRRCKSMGTEALLRAGITAPSFQAVTAGNFQTMLALKGAQVTWAADPPGRDGDEGCDPARQAGSLHCQQVPPKGPARLPGARLLLSPSSPGDVGCCSALPVLGCNPAYGPAPGTT